MLLTMLALAAKTTVSKEEIEKCIKMGTTVLKIVIWGGKLMVINFFA